jgi:predicted nucleic acid-binding protein
MRIVAARRAKSNAASRGKRVREQARKYPAKSSMAAAVHYVESSALLAALLEHDDDVRAILASGTRLVTSALTFAECLRGLVRARESKRLSVDDEQMAREAIAELRTHCASIPVTADVLDRAARPFSAEPVRTLDAIHLASLETLGVMRGAVTVLSRDRRVRENALQLGFAVV